ncbi:MAG TPA: hypothetical protein VGE35_02720 [Candidatus Paceibacterota bacterium]
MKLLSSGYQYDVYDLGNGLVLKQTVSFFFRLKKMFLVFRADGFGVIESLVKAIRSNKASVETTRRIGAMLTPELGALLANPRFKDRMSYEQDKITMVEDYIPAHAIDENKSMIDSYIKLRLELWRHGIHDYVFKFKGNHGVDAQGRVVLVDFNELYFTMEEALQSIQGKKWLSLPQYRKWEEGELKSYYTKAMEEAMTEENLNKNWR